MSLLVKSLRSYAGDKITGPFLLEYFPTTVFLTDGATSHPLARCIAEVFVLDLQIGYRIAYRDLKFNQLIVFTGISK